MKRETSKSLMLSLVLLCYGVISSAAASQPYFPEHQQVQTGNLTTLEHTLDAVIPQISDINQSENAHEKSAERSSSVAYLRSKDCRNVETKRTANEGVIRFTEPMKACNAIWTWIIDVSAHSDGIILQFHEVFLRYKCIMQVYTVSEHSNERVSLRNFTAYRKDFMLFSPLLLHNSYVELVLNAPPEVYKINFITFHISYEAYPIAKMPIRSRSFEISDITTNPTIYNCSSSVPIPSAFRCNMVKQCVYGEDENECEYIKQGCEDGWMPYKDQCLRMEFLIRFSMSPGKSLPTHPIEAEKMCVSKYGGTLASLPDSEGIRLVGNALRQFGMGSVVVGIKKVKPLSWGLRQMYRFLWQWDDKGGPLAYDQQTLQRDGALEDCATLEAYPSIYLQPVRCTLPASIPDGYVCMKPNPTRPKFQTQRVSSINFPYPSSLLQQVPTKRCWDGSLVQLFHSCQSTEEVTQNWSPNGFSLFVCRYGPPVHYTLVCDGNDDCADGSDEMDCREPKHAPLRDSTFVCDSLQLVDQSQRCDGKMDCFDESDERYCSSCKGNMFLCGRMGCIHMHHASSINSCPPTPIFRETFLTYNPSVVSLNGYGLSKFLEPSENNTEGTFRCADGDYIPSFLLNNGEQDCKHGDDEDIFQGNISCPGYYRCYYHGQCLHPKFVCDGIYHCPNKDDERYCRMLCPANCTCEGHAYSCTMFPELNTTLQARYLDLSGSNGVSLHRLQYMELLQFLNLSGCGLKFVYIQNMSQLHILDLSFNQIKGLSTLHFEGLIGLRMLNLSGNPLVETLDLTFDRFVTFSGLIHLRELVMTNTDLRSVQDRSLRSLTNLVKLDIRSGWPRLSYGSKIFFGMQSLSHLLTDDPKLCCSYFHHSFEKCIAPFDEMSSCSDLLRLNFFRVFLWTMSVLAVVGNAGVIVYRAMGDAKAKSGTSLVLVCNLCTADLLMGIYMMIIGAADALFKGIYVAKENDWKQSPMCKSAGFIGLLSSEVSALAICLITLDRLLVLCFPLKSSLHLTRRSALACCGLIWVLGVIIAAIPLLAGLEFYGQTSICLPLPITRRSFSGQYYAFGIFIVLNFIIFMCIGIGQVLIYRTIRKASKAAGAQRRSQEMAIARRLFLVVFTDFCCWFPVCVMGLLATSGVPISGEINVWAAIFILPLNSALNPFLYTLNGVLEKWRAERLRKKTRKILGNMQVELPKLHAGLAEEVVRVCVTSQVAGKDKILKWLQIQKGSNLSYVCSTDLSSEKTSSQVL